MCFSAAASFAAGAALLPVGAFCVHRAVQRDRRFLPLALTPVAFAAQQAAEGCVWLGLNHGDPVLAERGAVVFLFFALAFWPFWIPFSLLCIEGRRPGRILLAAMTVLSLVWLWLFAPLAADPGRLLSTAVVHHSIAYDFSDLPAFHLVPRTALRVAYLAFICVPLLAARPGGEDRLRFLAGALVAALFGFSYLVYWYAFTSVWCFFAALLALLLGVAFARLPARAAPLAGTSFASFPERNQSSSSFTHLAGRGVGVPPSGGPGKKTG
jgi:hypothetical protein